MSQVPFDEQMYEILKKSILLLSERSKTNTPLSLEDATWFKDAVELIIADAKAYLPPPKPPRQYPPQSTITSKNSEYVDDQD